MNKENEPKMPAWRAWLKRVLPAPWQNVIVRVKALLLLKAVFLPARILRLAFKPRRILFYPGFPHRENSVIAKICYLQGYRMINDPAEKFNAVIDWQSATYPVTDERLSQLAQNSEVVNAECNDLSKEHIDSVFKGIFGYSIMIDPVSYGSDCVVKSNENARHDGKIVKCPMREKQAGVVYQKLIDNRCGDNLVEDIRVPVFRRKIPFLYLKYRDINNRFSNDNRKVRLAEVSDVLSDEETEKIIRFSVEMKLDYGELDALRERSTKRLYIVDVNNTPWGPPNHISPGDYRKALRLLAKAFEEEFLKR